jgi:4-azaleucine resistance transporter AzlC
VSAVTEQTARPGVRQGVRAAIPLAVAVGAFGVSFGVLAGSAGMDGVAAVVMSATTFAGSAQLAAVSVLGAGGGAAAATLAAVLLNTRYLPMGLAFGSSLEGGRLRRLLESQLVVDESWALSHHGGGQFHRRLMLGAGGLLYSAWVVGTAAGVLTGNALGKPETLGLDAAFPALFLALMVGQVRSRRAAGAALAGAALALALVPFVPAGLPVVAATLACLPGLRAPSARPVTEEAS